MPSCHLTSHISQTPSHSVIHSLPSHPFPSCPRLFIHPSNRPAARPLNALIISALRHKVTHTYPPSPSL
ncbi:hypothetical protein BKA81DRAFT_348214 [Phyllosticta paracitricarpa]